MDLLFYMHLFHICIYFIDAMGLSIVGAQITVATIIVMCFLVWFWPVFQEVLVFRWHFHLLVLIGGAWLLPMVTVFCGFTDAVRSMFFNFTFNDDVVQMLSLPWHCYFLRSPSVEKSSDVFLGLYLVFC
jgi:hypothetical protein